MTSGLEAAGDVVTGVVVARAVEPAHGGGAPVTGGACLNCGAALAGAFCHDCGQRAHAHPSSGAQEMLRSLSDIAGKAWRTLPLLVARPGVLTRRYVQGQRARFVAPLTLFLFCVFLMFAAFQVFGAPFGSMSHVSRGGNTLTPAQVSAELARARTELAALQAQRAAAQATGKSTEALDEKIEEQGEEIAALDTADSWTHSGLAERKPGDAPKTGVAALDDYLRRAFKNPELLVYKLQTSAYKYAWALIPLSLPFMWAMFMWRRNVTLYAHAVFVTYSISAVMLLLSVMAVLSAAGLSSQGFLLLLVPLHFFLQLKEAYGLDIFGALWRAMALVVVACITIVLFGVALLAQSL